MKRQLYIKLFLGFFLVIVSSACTNEYEITEKDAPQNLGSFNESDVLNRMVAIKNGLTPKVKPTGEYKPAKEEAEQAPPPAGAEPVRLEPLFEQFDQVIIKTNFGDIRVSLYGNESPITVNAFLNLAKNGFYNGTKFHRVIKDFMIQGGDPLSKDDNWADDGQGGPGYQFQDEINSHKLVRGSLAMANSGPDTNGSQFFITTVDTAWLDGKHTNFGYVVSGMEVVDKIEAVETNENKHPIEGVVVESIEMASSK